MAVINDISTADPIVIPVGATQPPILYSVAAPDGYTQDMTGYTVTFFMRPLLSRTPVELNGTATTIVPADDDGNNVQYEWGNTDTILEGQFNGWFAYELPIVFPAVAQPIETPEFKIVITDQGPGFGTPTGIIVDSIGQWMPITLDRLRQDPNFGDRFLQKHADYIKRVVMGTIVAPDNEIDYDPMIVEYLAKRTAIRLITPAKEYWGRQYRSVSSQGPSENASYPDMLANLDALKHHLHHEAIQDWRQMQFMGLSLPQLHVEPRPMSSLGDPSPVNRPTTPDPKWNNRPATGGPFWGDVFMP